MLRRVMAIKLRENVPPAKVGIFEEALLATPEKAAGVLAARLGRNIAQPGEWSYGWDLAFDGADGLSQYRSHSYHNDVLPRFFNPGPDHVVKRATWITFEPYAGETPEPMVSDFIKRTLVIQVKPGTPKPLVREFEERLTQMPRYIEGIRNWAMSRYPQTQEHPVSSGGPVQWTHVWEQEFRDLGGIKDYMDSPFHWGVVDLWFDRDGPYNIVDRYLHIYYPCTETILGFRP